jgi:hypothetical protein
MFDPTGSLRILFRKCKSTLRAIVLDGFDLNPFKPVTLFQQQKRVTRKCRSLVKFLTAKNGLFLGANRVVVSNVYLPDANTLT